RIGFLSYARNLAQQIAEGKIPPAKLVDTQRLIFNNRLDAVVTAVLALMVLVLIAEALIQWSLLLSRRRPSLLHETPYVRTKWLPEFTGASAPGDAVARTVEVD